LSPSKPSSGWATASAYSANKWTRRILGEYGGASRNRRIDRGDGIELESLEGGISVAAIANALRRSSPPTSHDANHLRHVVDPARHPLLVTALLAAIPSPSTNAVHLGPFTLHIYGLCYAVAVIVAVAITRRRWVAQGGTRELVYDVALWGFPAGIIGGRLYYLATTPGDSFDDWWRPFAVWHGGLGIWGGIALGTLVGIWRIRRAGANVASVLDAAAPALLVAQAIGRVGNYFNQELFGRPTDLPWALEIDPEHHPRATSPSRPFIRRSSTSSPGICCSRRRSCGSGATGRSVRPACSRSTSPATARSASSTRRSASTPPHMSSECAGTCYSHSPAP